MIAISEATDTSRSGRRNVGERREKQMSFKALIGLPVLCLALVGCGDKTKSPRLTRKKKKTRKRTRKRDLTRRKKR